MKKILFVHETFGRLAGAEQNILVTAPHLAKTFRLECLYWNRSGKDEAAFEALFPVSHPVAFDGQPDETRNRVAGVLRQSAPDLVYVHKCIANPVLEALTEWGGPLVRMEHDHDIYCMRSYKYFPWSRRICTRKAGPCCLFPCLAFLKRDRMRGRFGVRWVGYRRQMRCIELNRKFSAMFVVTAYMRDELIRQGFAPERIHIFPPIPPPSGDAFQSTFAATNRIVFAGQIIRGKGLDALLRALALCKQPFRLTVLGSGSHQGACEALARRLGIADRVEFPGFVPFEKMAGYYREATLVAVPSLWPEPIATIGLEVLRYGLPVVGFDAGGIRDWLRDGETGFLIPWMDLRAMAEKIDFLLARKDEARRLGEQGRAFVNREYAFTPYVERMKATLGEMIGEP
ncbi:MAG: glycosyltransferase family 4 protein [Lentisphaerae bacterium]|nr:glycosyltransferase family 4 protein [Lentisphaerota bacterium]